jgi:hypothetical protein
MITEIQGLMGKTEPTQFLEEMAKKMLELFKYGETNGKEER